MKMVRPQKDAVIVGFDSAWVDNPKAPGAICAVAFDEEGRSRFIEPEPVSFDEALEFIRKCRAEYSYCLVSIDQPTIVPNMTRSRPVDRVAASVVSFAGGGVQPANRSKSKIFGAEAPIWRFKKDLDAVEDPEACRIANAGSFIVEVYPALALSGFHEPFAARLGAPKYNPKNKKKFKHTDWKAVANLTEAIANHCGLVQLVDWAKRCKSKGSPNKLDQDCLDAAICALIGLGWRSFARETMAVVGDTSSGYMVTPVSEQIYSRLEKAASKNYLAVRRPGE